MNIDELNSQKQQLHANFEVNDTDHFDTLNNINTDQPNIELRNKNSLERFSDNTVISCVELFKFAPVFYLESIPLIFSSVIPVF